MNNIKLKARAKINLTLDVVGKLPDGYHLLESIMQSVKLSDNLFMQKTCTGRIKLKTNLPWLPTDEKNLVYQAVSFMRERFSLGNGVFVYIKKRIPVGAGLGGGSADCAAAVFGMNLLFDLKLSFEEMAEICRNFGTDIPFCLLRGTALATGLGDRLEILPDAPFFHVVLAKPPFGVSTAHVYQSLHWETVKSHPDTAEMARAVVNSDRKTLAAGLCNVLESVTLGEHPICETLKERLLSLGAEGAALSGSGPTVFGLFSDKSAAEQAADAIKEEFGIKDVFLTEFFKNRNGEINYGKRF